MGFEEVDRKPLYLQVAEQIREAILRGDLAPGARLPTERELGGTFGVSRASAGVSGKSHRSSSTARR